MLEGFEADNFILTVDVDHNGGILSDVIVRRVDRNNGYLIRLLASSGTNVTLYKLEDVKRTALGSGSYTVPGDQAVSVKVKVNGSSLIVWVDGTWEFTVTDSTFLGGGVAFASDVANYDNLRVGFDNSDPSDSDILDAGDDIYVNEDWSGTPNKKWWPDRQSLDEPRREFEAESAAYLVCERLGVKTLSYAYLAGYYCKKGNVPEISLECVVKVAGLVEQMGHARLKPRPETDK